MKYTQQQIDAMPLDERIDHARREISGAVVWLAMSALAGLVGTVLALTIN